MSKDYKWSSSSIEVDISGLSQTLRLLDAIPKEIANRIERRGLKKAMQVMESAVRKRAPSGPTRRNRSENWGKLRDSIKLKITRRKGFLKGEVAATVPQALWLEKGHKMIGPKPKKVQSKTRPFVHPKPFMLPALNACTDEVFQVFGDTVMESIIKYEKKSK